MVIITGATGYIGSHIAQAVALTGEQVIGIDHYPHGNIIDNQNITYAYSDIARIQLSESGADTLIHCAAQIEVSASVTHPGLFYTENVAKTIALFDWARVRGIKHILFASSCAVYGTPPDDTFRETDPLNPISPYGETKRIVEQLLTYYTSAYGITSLAFRFANAAGASHTPSGMLGENHQPETHLIPRIIQAGLSSGESIKIFGTDYPTPDGTCIRDYVHVRDIAKAHVLGINYLRAGGKSGAYNLGSGRGYSVREVIEEVEHALGRRVAQQACPRRAGDPARLVADITRVTTQLDWQPQESLQSMVADAVAYAVRTSKDPCIIKKSTPAPCISNIKFTRL